MGSELILTREKDELSGIQTAEKKLTRGTCGAVQIRKYGGLRLHFREVATDESMITGGSFGNALFRAERWGRLYCSPEKRPKTCGDKL